MTATLLERIKTVATGQPAGSDALTEPTAELPELAEGFDRDPEPSPAARKPERKAAASRATAAKQTRVGGKFVSTKAQTAAVSDEIDMMLKMLAMTWSLSDEHCGGALNDTSTAIAADLARLVGRSEWLMERVTTGGLLLDIIKFLSTSMPFVRAVWAHHGPGSRLAEHEEEAQYEEVHVAPDRYAPFRPNIATA